MHQNVYIACYFSIVSPTKIDSTFHAVENYAFEKLYVDNFHSFMLSSLQSCCTSTAEFFYNHIYNKVWLCSCQTQKIDFFLHSKQLRHEFHVEYDINIDVYICYVDINVEVCVATFRRVFFTLQTALLSQQTRVNKDTFRHYSSGAECSLIYFFVEYLCKTSGEKFYVTSLMCFKRILSIWNIKFYQKKIPINES